MDRARKRERERECLLFNEINSRQTDRQTGRKVVAVGVETSVVAQKKTPHVEPSKGGIHSSVIHLKDDHGVLSLLLGLF